MIVPYSLEAATRSLSPFDARLHILAGHYCVNKEFEELGPDNDAELTSFEIGLELLIDLRLKGKEVKLYLWINDIGIAPEERERFKSHFTLPEPYENLVRNKSCQSIKDHFVILFESTIRNRASGIVKKVRKESPHLFDECESNDPRLIRCVDSQGCGLSDGKKVYTIKSRSGAPIVVKEGPNPKCNLILATLFDVILTRNGSGRIINVFNSIYSNRIELGQYVYEKLFSKPSSNLNIFCDMLGGASIVTNYMESKIQECEMQP